MPGTFISYSHDSRDRVAKLVERLRAYGMPVTIDSDMGPGGPPEGWPIWCEAQVRDADRVLIACTEIYCRRYDLREAPQTGLGAVSEARVIRQLLRDANYINQKFRVVLFEGDDSQHVPLELKAYHQFSVYREEGFRDLVAWLGGASADPVPDLRWPVRDASHIWGLADRAEVSAIFEAMATGAGSKRVLLIAGSSNRGKTALVEELLRYGALLRLATARVDLKGCPSLNEVFETLKLDLGAAILSSACAASGTARFYELIADLQRLRAPLLLVFDTYEQATDETRKFVETQLLPRLERAPGLILVISGQKVPERGAQSWWPLTERVVLEPIRKPSDWLAYAQKKWGSGCVSPAQIECLALATGGDPGQLSALIENLARPRPEAGA